MWLVGFGRGQVLGRHQSLYRVCLLHTFGCMYVHRLILTGSSINLTKLDVLDSFPELKIATEYVVDGEVLESFPGALLPRSRSCIFGILTRRIANLSLLDKAEIRYTTLPGWQSSTTGLTNYYDLPVNARKYVDFIEQAVDVPIKSIGTGPGRGDIIMRA